MARRDEHIEVSYTYLTDSAMPAIALISSRAR